MDGPEIKRRRKSVGLTQAALAEKVGVTQGTISAWETGLVSPSRERVEALQRALSEGASIAGSSPSHDYGEWLRGRREAAEKTREDLAAAAGVSAIQIYNIETGRTRSALERALNEQALRELVQAVEENAEIQGVGRLTDFDPQSEEDFPREPGVYVLLDISDSPIYVGKSGNIRDRLREHVDKFLVPKSDRRKGRLCPSGRLQVARAIGGDANQVPQVERRDQPTACRPLPDDSSRSGEQMAFAMIEQRQRLT
jgi:transcriptional regulator with XRE-family HTH domain